MISDTLTTIERLGGEMSENMASVYQKINKRRQKDEMDVNALTMFGEAWNYQQAEIDELQKRIDELEWFAKSIRNWDAHPKDLEINNGSWGVRDFYRNYADNVLKGESNEH